MERILCNCLSIEKLDLSYFKIDKVEDMEYMLHGCESLKDLNISNFIFNNSRDIKYMFSKCSEELKNKIKKQYNDIKKNAFFDYEEYNYDYYDNNSFDYGYDYL